nr:IS4 family transposase [Nitrosomonas nitrosa]
MQSPLRKYLGALRHYPLAALSAPQHYFRRPGKDFTRTRILHLERIAWLNITLLKCTLCVELDQFFSWLNTGEHSPTKSALVQARQKLLPPFFRDFFQISVATYYHCFKIKRWKGFRLWATDGTGFRLPDEPDLGQTFGWHGNQHNRVPSARVLVCFDLLNQIITALQFHTRNTAEVVMASRSVAQIPKDVIMVYDRGYSSHIIPFLHLYYGSNCIIRMATQSSKTIQAFIKSGKNQIIITERLQLRARLTLRELGISNTFRTTITYRLIRVILPTGKTEVLLTTLTDKKRFPWAKFGEIYKKRWGIETCFFVIKSFFQLTNFSAYTPGSCWQDIYSTFILYNIQTALHQPIQKEIRQLNNQRLHNYKPNRNVSAGLLKRFLVKFTLCPASQFKEYIEDYYRQIFQTMEPIRPDKNKERRRRVLRGTERHVHEKNYRRAI